MSPELIRSYALECLCLAHKTQESEHSELLLAMAHTWADLANMADRFQKYSDLKEELATASALSRLVNAEHPFEGQNPNPPAGLPIVISE
jgi:hypothetical protein